MKSLGKFPDPFIAGDLGPARRDPAIGGRPRRPTPHARASGGGRTGTDHRVHRDGELVRRVLSGGDDARGRGCAGPAHRRVGAAAFPQEPPPTCRAARDGEPIGRERRGGAPDRGARASRGRDRSSSRSRTGPRTRSLGRPTSCSTRATGDEVGPSTMTFAAALVVLGSRGHGCFAEATKAAAAIVEVDRAARSAAGTLEASARRSGDSPTSSRHGSATAPARSSSAAALPAPRPRWVRSR